MIDINVHNAKQQRAVDIFQEIKNLIYPGISELKAKNSIIGFLENHPEVEKFWHPVVVKFDQSTANPEFGYQPSNDVQCHSIALVDVGFVIEGYEVDYAETWLLRPNKKMQQLVDSAKIILAQAISEITRHTPSSLYRHIQELALMAGFKQIAESGGHRLGYYPTKKSDSKIKANNPTDHFDSGGWMVEVHISDGQYGAFFENVAWI